MDPNACLEKIRDLYERLVRVSDAEPDAPVAAEDAQELAEAVNDLDDWLCKGGFLPSDWNRNR